MKWVRIFNFFFTIFSLEEAGIDFISPVERKIGLVDSSTLIVLVLIPLRAAANTSLPSRIVKNTSP